MDAVVVNTGAWKTVVKRMWRIIAGILIPVILLPLAVNADSAMRCAYVLCVMALYWVIEPIPLAATALLPIALLPLLGILSTEQASIPYMKSANSLFIGGLLMAIAIEGSHLHKRVAFGVLLLVGASVKRIMFGLMVTTMFLSMWISNTATTAMMVPVVDAMVNELTQNLSRQKETGSNSYVATVSQRCTGKEESIEMNSRDQIIEETVDNKKEKTNQDINVLRKALLLSVAYAANIGGTGTITGTGTNIVLQNLIDDKYGGKGIITFAKWILYAFPGAVICICISWTFLFFFYIRTRFPNKSEQSVQQVVKERYKQLGPITFHEIVVAIFFVLLVLLWFFRDPGFIKGWDSLVSTKVSDGTPAMLIAVAMFLVPTNYEQFKNKSHEKVKTVLDWQTVQKRMPWGVFLLLGGGFSLAEATEKSKLSDWLSEQLYNLQIPYPAILVILLTVIAAFITEIASNVATASVILPIVNKTAIDMKVNPLLFLMPVTIAVSFAFMFPVATPPNAIVFEHLGMRPVEMMKPGIVMNIVCISVALAMIYTWGFVVFDLSEFPDWTQNLSNLPNSSFSSNH